MPECPKCRKPGRSVGAAAVAHHAKGAEVTDSADGWHLCPSGPDCDVVYFRGGDMVLVSEVGALPFHKGAGPERTVCFCFAHTERDLAEDVRQHGTSSLRDAIAKACREGRSDCEVLNPEGRCCLGNVAQVLKTADVTPSEARGHACCSTRRVPPVGAADASEPTPRTTLDTLRSWAGAGARFSMFTCYDATTARWLYRGGARVLLVGDSAAQVVLGLDPTARASLGYMAAIGAAVKRGAPDAFVVVDYPDDLLGSVSDHAERIRTLARETGADAIKIESDAAGVLGVLASTTLVSIPIVAHLAPRQQACKCCSDQGTGDLDPPANSALVADAVAVADAGAAAVLLGTVAPEAATAVVDALRRQSPGLPVFGCHCGGACPGQVEMLHDLFGLRGDGTDDGVGHAIVEAVRRRLRSSSQNP